jgi:hypothetical protein
MINSDHAQTELIKSTIKPWLDVLKVDIRVPSCYHHTNRLQTVIAAAEQWRPKGGTVLLGDKPFHLGRFQAGTQISSQLKSESGREKDNGLDGRSIMDWALPCCVPVPSLRYPVFTVALRSS